MALTHQKTSVHIWDVKVAVLRIRKPVSIYNTKTQISYLSADICHKVCTNYFVSGKANKLKCLVSTKANSVGYHLLLSEVNDVAAIITCYDKIYEHVATRTTINAGFIMSYLDR